jgi:HEPN domain-containing protein
MNEYSRQQVKRQYPEENGEPVGKSYQERATAIRELIAQVEAWAAEEQQQPRSQRAESRMLKAVERLAKEILDGQTENLAERFQQAADLAVASTLPKRKGTYPKTLTALRQLLDLHTAWTNAEPRSTAEQQKMLHQLRRLLYEIAAGEIEQIAERFTNLAEATTPIGDSLPEEKPEQAGS